MEAYIIGNFRVGYIVYIDISYNIKIPLRSFLMDSYGVKYRSYIHTHSKIISAPVQQMKSQAIKYLSVI